MPALNVDFSEDELTELRSVAQERGVTLKALVRGAVAEDLAHHRALTSAASVFRSFVDDNVDAFAAAFPDDSPGTGRHPGRSVS